MTLLFLHSRNVKDAAAVRRARICDVFLYDILTQSSVELVFRADALYFRRISAKCLASHASLVFHCRVLVAVDESSLATLHPRRSYSSPLGVIAPFISPPALPASPLLTAGGRRAWCCVVDDRSKIDCWSVSVGGGGGSI